jgi:hypothetical protein
MYSDYDYDEYSGELPQEIELNDSSLNYQSSSLYQRRTSTEGKRFEESSTGKNQDTDTKISHLVLPWTTLTLTFPLDSKQRNNIDLLTEKNIKHQYYNFYFQDGVRLVWSPHRHIFDIYVDEYQLNEYYKYTLTKDQTNSTLVWLKSLLYF